MARIAALFGGQGSQYPGMAKSLYEASGEVRALYALGSDILGFDLAKTSFEGDEDELSRTAVSQPVVFAHSLAAWTFAQDALPAPVAVAGHSLGEYAALCCAGAYSVEDGFRIIKARAAAMEHAAQTAKGTMYAVIGLDAAEIERICAETQGGVWAVNYNLPAQTAISGEEEACAAAAAACEAAGASKCTRLKVGSAFHTPLMQPAAELLRAELETIRFGTAGLDFYSNLTGDKLVVEDFVDYFVRHMLSPVRFTSLVAAMVRDGVDTCVEYGPKKTAATLAKKNERGLAVANVDDLDSLEKAKKLFA